MTEAKPESKITIGAVLVDKYRVTREIGRGGMAAVYEAVHLALGKMVAVKVLAADLAASTTVIERFFREARAAASVKSPYIVDIYDSGRLEDGRPFIAMEMLDGETLYDLMTRVRLIDFKTTIRIINQCAKGLMKAHAVGIVHRDLKPENIFLLKNDEGEDTLKLLDFGLAKFYAPMNPDEQTARLTREGAVFGTPAYMSPEQVKGKGTVDHRADLWALGCITFECLTGRPVWNTEQGVAMTFAAIAASALPVPSQLRPDVPPAFDAWFARALERDPELRFQSARDLADALAIALGEGEPGGVRSGDVDVAALLSQIGRNSLDAEAPLSPGGGGAFGASTANAFAPAVDSGRQLPHGPESGRLLVQSAQDVPGTASPASAPRIVQRRGMALRYTVSTLALLVSSGGAYLTWDRVLRPQVRTQLVQSTVPFITESPAASSNATTLPPTRRGGRRRSRRGSSSSRWATSRRRRRSSGARRSSARLPPRRAPSPSRRRPASSAAATARWRRSRGRAWRSEATPSGRASRRARSARCLPGATTTSRPATSMSTPCSSIRSAARSPARAI